MNTLTILTLTATVGGGTEQVHPVVLQDGHNTVLVDCGYRGSLPDIEAELARHHIDPAHLTHVIITHHDHDHVGALGALKEKYPEVRIVATAEEAQYISGREKSPRLAQAEALQQVLPEAQKPFGEFFLSLLRSIEPVEVDHLVKAGDRLDWCGGCEVVDTRGHTPGHISLLLPAQGTLIAGDAAVLENGALVIANPQFTLDIENAQKSLEWVKAAPVKTIICYHGGAYIK